MTLDIMIPFWGNPGYLFETVRSVLAQDDPNWRLVVVDDCYPDDRVAKCFEQIDDPRVEYTRNETNLGITENYKRCLQLSRSDYLMFLGCDDLLLPNFVSVVQKDIEENPSIDVIQPNVQTIDEIGSVINPLSDRAKALLRPGKTAHRHIITGEPAVSRLLTGDWLYWPSLVFRRDRLLETPFRSGFPLIQDLALIVDILMDGGCILVDSTVCFQYRRHNASASSAKLFEGTRFTDERRYFELAADLARSVGWRRARISANLHLTSRLYALTLLPQAIRISPQAVAKLTRHALGK